MWKIQGIYIWSIQEFIAGNTTVDVFFPVVWMSRKELWCRFCFVCASFPTSLKTPNENEWPDVSRPHDFERTTFFFSTDRLVVVSRTFWGQECAYQLRSHSWWLGWGLDPFHVCALFEFCISFHSITFCRRRSTRSWFCQGFWDDIGKIEIREHRPGDFWGETFLIFTTCHVDTKSMSLSCANCFKFVIMGNI